ncbi:MAG: hypothetical protein LBS01_00255 [Prevotellaceae bacterium]|nr:hypothetical protein [Prevotellaceae bacterium]
MRIENCYLLSANCSQFCTQKKRGINPSDHQVTTPILSDKPFHADYSAFR